MRLIRSHLCPKLDNAAAKEDLDPYIWKRLFLDILASFIIFCEEFTARRWKEGSAAQLFHCCWTEMSCWRRMHILHVLFKSLWLMRLHSSVFSGSREKRINGIPLYSNALKTCAPWGAAPAFRESVLVSRYGTQKPESILATTFTSQIWYFFSLRIQLRWGSAIYAERWRHASLKLLAMPAVVACVVCCWCLPIVSRSCSRAH